MSIETPPTSEIHRIKPLSEFKNGKLVKQQLGGTLFWLAPIDKSRLNVLNAGDAIAINTFLANRKSLRELLEKLGSQLKKEKIPHETFIDYARQQVGKAKRKAPSGFQEFELRVDEKLAKGLYRTALICAYQRTRRRIARGAKIGITTAVIAAATLGAKNLWQDGRNEVHTGPTTVPSLSAEPTRLPPTKTPTPHPTQTPEPSPTYTLEQIISRTWKTIVQKFGIDLTEGSRAKSPLFLGSQIALPQDLPTGDYQDFETDIFSLLAKGDVLHGGDRAEYKPGEMTETYIDVLRDENGKVKIRVGARGTHLSQANEFVYDPKTGFCRAQAQEPGGGNNPNPNDEGKHTTNEFTFDPKNPVKCIAKFTGRRTVLIGFSPNSQVPASVQVQAAVFGE